MNPNLIRQSLVITLLFLSSCASKFNDKKDIDKDDVNYVEIHKQHDTFSLRLTDQQVGEFIDKWNNSSSKGPYKYLPEFTLTIHFKVDSSLSYRTNNELIKQGSDWAYSVGDKEYFKKIWFKQSGSPDDYIKYHPARRKVLVRPAIAGQKR